MTSITWCRYCDERILDGHASCGCALSQPDIQTDPTGRDPHEPGAKLDATKIRAGLMGCGFARALEAVAEVTTYGAKKYTPNGWVSVPNAQERYQDALWRHLLRSGVGEDLDPESGLRHAAHAAWNCLALLELELRSRKAQ